MSQPNSQGCHYCSRYHEVLCDHRAPGRKRRCSRPLCREHAHHVEPDLDFCPEHTPDASQLAGKDASPLASRDTSPRGGRDASPEERPKAVQLGLFGEAE